MNGWAPLFWVRPWGPLLDALLVFLIIWLVTWLAGRFFTRFVFNRLLKWLENGRAEWLHSLLQSYERPLQTFWNVLGLYWP